MLECCTCVTHLRMKNTIQNTTIIHHPFLGVGVGFPEIFSSLANEQKIETFPSNHLTLLLLLLYNYSEVRVGITK